MSGITRFNLKGLLVLVLLGWLPTSQAEIAASPTEVRPVLIGHSVADAGLRDEQGEPASLADALGGKPTVIVFYRGGWCPFCNFQLGQLRDIQDDLTQLGVQLIAITPDPPGALRGVTRKHELQYQLLSDSDMVAAEAFGVAYRLGADQIARYKKHDIFMSNTAGEPRFQLPVPAIFLVNKEGTVEFTYVNPDPQIRIQPELLLTAARLMTSD
ncbi:MAG: peroxiredoxin-like family protein [Immundisolibacteraceae bacterium]|nr:peroxiredoxin-like family protein [Immundisolibacteraceae bacterium]